MARAKKTESGSSGGTTEPKGEAKRKAPAAAAKKPAGAKAPPAVAGMPMIDTSLAAAAAAKMLVARPSKPATSQQNPAGGSKAESAMFKQLKAGLAKPHAATMSNMLEKSHGPEPAKSHPAMKQVGHNQTFSADVTRSGVPRRTPG
jgi:hypothetical protein